MRKRIVPVALTAVETQLIAKLHSIGPDSFSASNVIHNGVDITEERNQLKKKIEEHLILMQEGHCAYCTVDLASTKYEIDHLAKKKPYNQLTWNVENLVCACTACNIRRKGNRDLTICPSGLTKSQISTPNSLSYKIVHPILNDPVRHLKWCNDRIFCSGHWTPEGELTISIFELTSAALTESRCMNYRRKTFGPIDENILKEIMKIPRST